MTLNIDRRILSDENHNKIRYLNNPHAERIIDEYVALCKPDRVTVITDRPEDIKYIRNRALELGEEATLAMEGHTIHFDGFNDQGRDKKNTLVLVTPDMKLSKIIDVRDREEGLKEIFRVMDGIMKGKECFVRFFCLGPVGSRFSIAALQITDSAYVSHSEDLLYRTGYEEFRKLNGSEKFFYLVHSAGELDERGNTKNVDQRRIYIDVLGGRVFTVNNQYAGNSVGLKKLSLRLAIFKANQEDWLTEHMFIMGVKPEDKNRITYFTGAFPSACGKTSTAMVPGQLIVGDDIAYIRTGKDGRAHTVNIEQGIFGIIEDVNPVDDPVIYEALTTPRELIFSNVLVKDGKPYWLGMGQPLPDEGRNFSGEWKKGKKDAKGNDILLAHKNARYTIRLKELKNVDPRLDDTEGVPISAVIYGGRDSDTSVPVYQSFDWAHGIFIGAILESETTAATLGAVGVRELSPMANLDFLVVPLGTYLSNHLAFGKGLSVKPLVFATNYFLKENGRFLNEKVDKKVWLLWMEGRVHGEYDAIETPIGYIPHYGDIRKLFKQVFNKEYSQADYDRQFTIRVDKFLEKLDRVEKAYREEHDIPVEFYSYHEKIRRRLQAARDKFNGGNILPGAFEQKG
ncbi:MAG: phosphoenolpyruvate carboxykinase [Spirochaetes bacterium RBG_13_51_14]|nr:MAG: phosphoenolpyruvate carboxykinase [Spirochaetes bacterium RBG_13_51_14]